MIIYASLTDRYRTLRNGKRKHVGQIMALENGKRRVIAEVYSDTLDECRRRKHVVAAALAAVFEDMAQRG